MRVICVRKDTKAEGPSEKRGILEEGKIYTVVDSETYNGKLFYTLLETDYFDKFWSMLFIPLSTIDETELIHQRQTELV